MIWRPLISNYFLQTCSLYVSYTSLPCVLLNSCVLTFFRGIAPKISYVSNTLLTDTPVAHFRIAIKSIFIFYLLCKTFLISQVTLVSFHRHPYLLFYLCIFLHGTCHHQSYCISYRHLFFVFLNLSINSVREMIFITLKKLIAWCFVPMSRSHVTYGLSKYLLNEYS